MYTYKQINERVSVTEGTPRTYDPNEMLNALLARLCLTDDTQLAEKLNLEVGTLTKIRERRLRMSPSLLVLIQQATEVDVPELRSLMHDRRRAIKDNYNFPNRRR